MAGGRLANGVALQSWSTDEGLPQNSVHAILQTHDGFLWAATEGGLARFDGLSFQVFQQSNESAFTSDDVSCLAEDRNEALWIGTANGLLRESGGLFERFGLDSGLPSATILSVAVDDDSSVLVLTPKGVARVDHGKVTALQVPENEAVLAISRAADGSVWLATANNLLLYKNNELHRERSISMPSSAGITGLAVVPSQQAVWLGSVRDVTLLQNGSRHTWSVDRELPGTRIQSLSSDSHGVVWIGTNRGLVSIDAASRAVRPVAGVGSTSVLSTMEDRDGDRWVGTETSGIEVLRLQSFRSVPAIADRSITAIVETTDGAIWLGTKEDGLWRVRSGVVDWPAISSKLASLVILALAPGNHGDLWVGTPDGLNHVDGGTVRTYTSANGLPDDFIRSLLVQPDGTVWAGTRRGLVALNGVSGDVLTIYTHQDGLQSDSIGALLLPTISRPGEPARAETAGDDLWVATFNGLSRLRNGHITAFTKASGFPESIVTALARDDSGALWIGTKGDGLSRYLNGAFTTFRQAGLPKNIDSIVPDGQGRLWMGTEHGVAEVSTAALNECGTDMRCTVPMSRYGYLDGLPSEDLAANGHPASWKMKNGELWFATPRGVAIVDPSRIGKNPVAPPVAIERFLVDDVEIPLTEKNIRIAPGNARVTIAYAGLSFRAPSQIGFRYMLEGFDQHWTAVGSRRAAYYTNLPPGSYRFRVQAASSDGLWNGASADISFTVERPYYRRWWFYLLILIVVGGLILLLHRLRLRRLQREFNMVLAERNRMAREIHDTLAQDFVGVSLQLEMVAQTLTRGDLPTARGQIDATRTLVREGLEDARQSIWELRAVSAKDSLPTRLSRIVKRAGERGLKAECRVGGTYRPLPPQREEEVLRIAQEAVSNVLRHAGASTLSVDLHYSSKSLRLRIEDDGCGFDVAAASTTGDHFGLKGMQERAAMINGRMQVESLTGKGTSMTIDVDI
ncbi:MAG: two-component regulator propeller domain-containing protein [Edaphobacter sp.]